MYVPSSQVTQLIKSTHLPVLEYLKGLFYPTYLNIDK